MKFLFKCVLPALLLSVYAISVWAIPKDLIAESEYTLAEKKFNESSYNEALEHLTNARALLGKTNSNIQYLLAKSYWELGQYRSAKKELEGYFDVTPQSAADPNRFKEMVALISQIEEKLGSHTDSASPPKQNFSGVAGNSPSQPNLPLTAGPLPIQEPSGNAGASQAQKARDQKISGEKWISLADAKQKGIPTPLEFKVVVGKTIKTYHKVKEYQYQGVMNKPLKKSKVYFRNEKIIFDHPDTGEYSYEVWLEYPGNPAKEENRSIHKRSKSQRNIMLRERFPVPLLKPGVSWNGSYSRYSKMPVRYKVSEIKTISGHDCIEVNGKGEVKDGNNLEKYVVSYCYDYNHNEFVYFNSRLQRFITNWEEPLVSDIQNEFRLESLTYE